MELESVEPQEVNANTKQVTTTASVSPPDDGTYKRVLLSVVAVCTLVFVASIVVIALSQGLQTGSLSAAGQEEEISRSIRQDARGRGKIWLLQAEHDWGAFAYINSTGYLAGFQQDLVREVCAAAGIRCAMVWDKVVNCIDSEAGLHNQGGKGLMARWYDACPGWMATTTRVSIFDFSVDFTKQAPVNFFTKPNDTNFNPNDIRGKIIVFMDGYASDENCLARQTGIKGNILSKHQILHAAGTKEYYDTIMNNTAAAGYSSDDAVRKYIASGQLKQVGPSRHCGLSGNAVMTRKDNTFNTHWNRGFEIIYSNGRYKQLCDSVKTKHAGQGHVECKDVY